AVRRPAPAPGPGPGAAAPPRAADAGRRHLGGRPDDRAADPRRAADLAPGHHADRRPPPVDHPPGRPGAVPGGRAHRRHRLPRPPGRHRARLRGAGPGLRGRDRMTAAETDAGTDVHDTDVEGADVHDAAATVLAESVPPGTDEERPHPEPTPDEIHILEA